MGSVLHHGDCLEVMAAMEAGSVDAICCDPPYGLEFMGKAWDKFDSRPTGGFKHGSDKSWVAGRVGPSYEAGTPAQHFHTAWALEALRVLKPSHYLLAFGGTRTWHRLACALEDAGFEIRDTLMWLYGSGFPKGKACLKPAWEPIILARKPGPMRELGIEECRVGTTKDVPSSPRRATQGAAYGDLSNDRADGGGWDQNTGRWPANCVIDSAVADALGEPGRFYFQGDYGWDDDVSLCASCAERVVQNARRGTSATKASTATKPADPTSSAEVGRMPGVTSRPDTGCSGGLRAASTATSSSIGASGRTPTDQSPGGPSSTTSTETRPTTGSKTCASCGTEITSPFTGEASLSGEPLTRFFYCAKASRAERNAGCEGMPEVERNASKWARLCNVCGCRFVHNRKPDCGHDDFSWVECRPTQNHHPTVKPLAPCAGWSVSWRVPATWYLTHSWEAAPRAWPAPKMAASSSASSARRSTSISHGRGLRRRRRRRGYAFDNSKRRD